MKKYLSLGFTFALTFQLLSGCSGAGDSSATTTSGHTAPENISTKEQVKSSDILAYQKDISQKLELELLEGGYTFENPFVVVNPYHISPLTGLVIFQTEESAQISIHVAGLRGGNSLENTFTEENTQHIIPIYGLYSEEATEVTLTAIYEDGREESTVLSVTGGELPSSLLLGDVVKAQPDAMAEGLTFVSIISPTNCAHALDCNGDVRWVYNAGGGATRTFPIIVLENGHFLTNISEGTTSYYKYGLQEFDLTGKIHAEYLLDATQHDVRELPSGNFLVLGDDANGTVMEDTVYELDRQTGEIRRAWDMDSYFNVPNVDSYGNHIPDENHGTSTIDWFHSNSLDYYENDNSMIVSGRNQDAILKFDLDTGELLWVFAPPEPDLWNTYLEEKLLTPEGDVFDYAYGQHNVQYMENGDLLLFDNGLYRGKSADSILPVEEGFSRLVQYQVDSETKTITQIWEYGQERGTELLSRFVSGVQHLGENHYLGHFGGIVRDDQGNPSYSYAVSLEKASNHTYIIELVNDEVVFEYHVNVEAENTDGNTYRSVRLNPYTTSTPPTLDAGIRLGALTSFGLVTESTLPAMEYSQLEQPVSATDTGITLTIGQVPTEFETMTLYFLGDSTYETPVELLNYQIKLVTGEVPIGTYDLFLQVDSVLYDLDLTWTNVHQGKEIPTRYEISVSSSNDSKGEAFGSGLYFPHTALTVTAMPKEGYTFLAWEEDGIVVCETEKYSFIPTENREFNAVFE